MAKFVNYVRKKIAKRWGRGQQLDKVKEEEEEGKKPLVASDKREPDHQASGVAEIQSRSYDTKRLETRYQASERTSRYFYSGDQQRRIDQDKQRRAALQRNAMSESFLLDSIAILSHKFIQMDSSISEMSIQTSNLKLDKKSLLEALEEVKKSVADGLDKSAVLRQLDDVMTGVNENEKRISETNDKLEEVSALGAAHQCDLQNKEERINDLEDSANHSNAAHHTRMDSIEGDVGGAIRRISNVEDQRIDIMLAVEGVGKELRDKEQRIGDLERSADDSNAAHSSRIGNIESHVDEVDTRIGKVEQNQEAVKETVDDLDGKMIDMRRLQTNIQPVENAE